MSNIDIYGMKDSAGNTLYFPNGGGGGGGGASLLRADYETSPATAAHAIDDILYYNNKFYDVTSAVAIGDTLTVSSGSTVGNISERLGGMSYEVFGIPGGGYGGMVTADDVSYDNTSSGLTATNVQDAIDEVNSNIAGILGRIVGIQYSETILGASHETSYTTEKTYGADQLVVIIGKSAVSSYNRIPFMIICAGRSSGINYKAISGDGYDYIVEKDSSNRLVIKLSGDVNFYIDANIYTISF